MRSVRLKTDAGEPRWLCLDEHGLWLMDSEDAIDGLDALKELPRYQSGRLKDRLEARGETYLIPAGKGGDVREMLAIARLRGPQAPLFTGPLIDSTQELDRAFVSGWLQPGEMLLALLQTTTPFEVESDVGDTASVDAWTVWTDQRAALVSIGPFGDLTVHVLSDSLEVESVRGRDIIRCGDHEWKTTLFNESRYAKVAPMWKSTPQARLRFAADEALAAGERDLARRYIGALDEPLAKVEMAVFDGDEIVGVEALERLNILVWADSWKFDAPARSRLRDALLAHDPRSSVGLILDEWLRETHLRKEKDLDAIVQLDVEHARSLVAGGRQEDAQKLLHERLSTLTPPEAADLIPHGTEGEREPQLRARVALLEMLHDAGDNEAELALARLEPMRTARLEPLDRPDARRAIELLEEGPRVEPRSPSASRAPFEAAEFQLLRHPIGRSDSFIAGIQALVARADVPDHGALKAFCAKLKDPAATSIFERAVTRMGGETLAFVSQGERALGCRAYDDGDASFLIVGACHLDKSDPRYLPPASLAFAFGSELAHVRFGHSRVTASDLWSGAFDVGVSGFDLLLSAVPLVGRWQGLAEGVSKLGNAIKDGTIGKFARRAGRALGVDIPEDSEEHLAAGQLLAAHRLMQLTADRAGLVLAADPIAAVRAILASHPSDVWERSANTTLRELMSERDEEGRLRFPELAVRVSALISFWLSEDYQQLAG